MINNKAKKKVDFGMLLEWLLLAVAVFGTLNFLTDSQLFDLTKPETLAGKLFLWPSIIIMAFVTLAIHELGHLLTGLAQGFKFQLFVVGPLGIKNENEKISVYFNKNLATYGGIAATMPTEDSPDNPRKFARLILAGPLASLLFAVLSLALAAVLANPWSIIFYSSGCISIAIFFATTIPSKTGLFFSDRKRFQRLILKGKDQEVEIAMLRIMGRYAQDSSYKNISSQDIAVLINDDIPFIRYFGIYNQICLEIEKDGVAKVESAELFQSLSADMPKALVQGMTKELNRQGVSLMPE